MTLNQIIYNLRNLIKDAKSDDIKISDRQFEFLINYVRARLIKQETDKGKTISENVKQDLGQISLSQVDSAEGTLLGGSTILKTPKLPKFLELNYKDCVVFVGSIDKLTPFQFTTKAYAHRVKHSKYASKVPHAYLKDGSMYIISPNNLLKYCNIQGVFESPREAYEFANPGSYYDESSMDYPLSSWMIETLNELIVTKDLNTFFQLPQDVKNDASSDDSAPQIKTQEMIRQNGGYGT